MKIFRISVAALGLFTGMLAASASSATTFHVLYTFTGGTDGSYPREGLIRDAAGNFYGTTAAGGTRGHGTVFRLTPDGAESVVHSFEGSKQGRIPNGVVADKNGSLYGSTSNGAGTNKDRCDGPGQNGCGAIYALTPEGNYRNLYRFHAGFEGARPGVVVRDNNGNFYGIASDILFEVSAGGKETVLHRFANAVKGVEPNFELTLHDGNIYGTTGDGGVNGVGTVFKIDTNKRFTILHNFGPIRGSDGLAPEGGVVVDHAGNVYGTTSQGGSLDNYNNCFSGTGCGVVFRIAPDGTETILHNFASSKTDGFWPLGRLSLDRAGNLYGATLFGGTGTDTDGCGTVFEITKAGVEKVLYSFKGRADGLNPTTGPLIDKEGRLYGNVNGGAHNAGVVFEIDP